MENCRGKVEGKWKIAKWKIIEEEWKKVEYHKGRMEESGKSLRKSGRKWKSLRKSGRKRKIVKESGKLKRKSEGKWKIIQEKWRKVESYKRKVEGKWKIHKVENS